jgi:probable phosphoglycerate mutase
LQYIAAIETNVLAIMTRFLLIRHATTNAVGKRLAGRTPAVDLNDEGRLQASLLAESLEKIEIAAIYSSPLERAVQTAQPISDRKQIPIQIHQAFLELDFGDWTNRAISDLVDDPVFKRFNMFRSATRIPSGEMMTEAQLRIVEGMQQLTQAHLNETVAIVSHADIIKSAVAFYAGIHLDLFHRIEISPASVTIIEVFEETARLMLVNHTGAISF